MAAIWILLGLALALACNPAPKVEPKQAPEPAATAATSPAGAIQTPVVPIEESPAAEPPRPETTYAPLSLPLTSVQPIQPETHYVPPVGYVSERISRQVDGVTVEGRLLLPTNPKGAVLIIPEWWGVNAQIQRFSEEIATWNYAVLAIDFYGGKVAQNRGEAANLARGLNADVTANTLKAAVTLLAESGTTSPLQVGAVGWDWGGTLVLRFSADEPRLKAVIATDAQPPIDPERLKKLTTPILAFFCTRGGYLTKEEIDAFMSDMTKLGNKPQLFRFTTAPGTLLAPVSIQDQAYASTARQRMREFLDKYVGQ